MFARGAHTLLVLLVLGSAARAQGRPGSQSELRCGEARLPYAEWAIDHQLDLDLPPVMYFDCPSCAADELPQIVMRERDTGTVHPGAVEWLYDEHGARVPFVRWIAGQALAEGDYEADVTLPPGFAELDDNPWSIQVQRGPAPRPELVLELDEEVQSGWTYVGATLWELCGWEPNPCGTDAFGTRRIPHASLRVFGRPDYEEVGIGRVSGAFVYRASAYADGERIIDGDWGNLIVANDSRVTLHLRSERALGARELCVELESLRVTDGALATQPRKCIDNSARRRPSQPVPYVPLSDAQRAACVGPDAGAGDPWLTAWCDDNFLDCDSSSFLGAAGCADFRSHCQGYEVPGGVSHRSGTEDAGPRATALGVAPADGGCGVASPRRSPPATGSMLVAIVLAVAACARRRLRYNAPRHVQSDPDPCAARAADPDHSRGRRLRRHA